VPPATTSDLPFFFELVFAFCFSLAVPFLGGVSNVIGWIIIAVGLIEAWRLNKRIPIEVRGPFDASAAGPQPPPLQT
jgi:hypothetical protein